MSKRAAYEKPIPALLRKRTDLSENSQVNDQVSTRWAGGGEGANGWAQEVVSTLIATQPFIHFKSLTNSIQAISPSHSLLPSFAVSCDKFHSHCSSTMPSFSCLALYWSLTLFQWFRRWVCYLSTVLCLSCVLRERIFVQYNCQARLHTHTRARARTHAHTHTRARAPTHALPHTHTWADGRTDRRTDGRTDGRTGGR